jgi:hypothetical protein
MTDDGISLSQYFAATALTLWAILMMVLISVLVGAVKAISTSNLLLVMILATMAFKMFAENANDVTVAVADAVKTLLYRNRAKGDE